MKKSVIIIALLGFIFSFTNIDARNFNKYHRNIDVEYFYGALEPFGEWIEIDYDEYAWRPYDSDYNWRPYSEGRWEWTRNGWYWVSYEPFGWATYHYGRWFYDDYYGWLWMPDNVWAPAWVEWRYNNNYIGWAPLPPYARFDRRRGIRFSISWNSHYTNWNFVTYNNFVSYNVNNYFINHNVQNVYNRTKYRTNYFADNNRIVNGGINRRFVENRLGRKLTTRRIDRTNNFSTYNNSRGVKTRRIVDYRPANREIESSRNNFSRKRIIKGRSSSTLNRDKIVINRNKTSQKRGSNKPRTFNKRKPRHNSNTKFGNTKNERKLEKRNNRKNYGNNRNYERQRTIENGRISRKHKIFREKPRMNRNSNKENNVTPKRKTTKIERKNNSRREVYKSRKRSSSNNEKGNVNSNTRSSNSERSRESKREIKKSRR